MADIAYKQTKLGKILYRLLLMEKSTGVPLMELAMSYDAQIEDLPKP